MCKYLLRGKCHGALGPEIQDCIGQKCPIGGEFLPREVHSSEQKASGENG